MIRTIQFEGHSVEINTSAGWLFAYRTRFGRDILPDIMPVIESILQLSVDTLGKVDTDDLTPKKVIEAIDGDTLEEVFAKMAGAELITVYQIFWATAKNANTTIEGPEAFFNKFDTFPMGEVAPQLLSAIIESNISSKNAASLLKKLKIQNRSTLTESLSLVSTEG